MYRLVLQHLTYRCWGPKLCPVACTAVLLPPGHHPRTQDHSSLTVSPFILLTLDCKPRQYLLLLCLLKQMTRTVLLLPTPPIHTNSHFPAQWRVSMARSIINLLGTAVDLLTQFSYTEFHLKKHRTSMHYLRPIFF